MTSPLAHLEALESESIHIFREAAAQFRRPVLLYTVGKDPQPIPHIGGGYRRKAPSAPATGLTR
jgi:sulfate adenylyltransferase subunit 2